MSSETEKAPKEEMFNVTPKLFCIRNQINLERSDCPAYAVLLWIIAERRGATEDGLCGFSLSDSIPHRRLWGAPEVGGMPLARLPHGTTLQMLRLICSNRKGRFLIRT